MTTKAVIKHKKIRCRVKKAFIRKNGFREQGIGWVGDKE
jgi:hypothetical protein